MICLVLASDRNLIRQAGVTALSAVRCSSEPLHITFLTPPQDASHPHWSIVTSLVRKSGVDCTLIPVTFDSSNLQLSEHLTPVTYYRLLLPHLLPDRIGRVIYLDCDVVVRRDLSELWKTNLLGMPIAAVEDIDFRNWSRLGIDEGDGYFNAGVLLIDLDAVRAHKWFDAALEFSQRNPSALTWSDQCALNKTLVGNWRRLEKSWNYQHSAFLEDIRTLGMGEARRLASTYVIHFNNYERPWLVDSPHPLKPYYSSIADAYPDLDLSPRRQLQHCWKLMKRTVKWKTIAWQGR